MGDVLGTAGVILALLLFVLPDSIINQVMEDLGLRATYVSPEKKIISAITQVAEGFGSKITHTEVSLEKKLPLWSARSPGRPHCMV